MVIACKNYRHVAGQSPAHQRAVDLIRRENAAVLFEVNVRPICGHHESAVFVGAQPLDHALKALALATDARDEVAERFFLDGDFGFEPDNGVIGGVEFFADGL